MDMTTAMFPTFEAFMNSLPKFIDTEERSYKLVVSVTEDEKFIAFYEDTDVRNENPVLASESSVNIQFALTKLYITLVNEGYIKL